MCKWGNDVPVTLPSGKVVDVDSCIADFVDRLNKAGINTIASCCGHGRLPPTIAFGDDQWMMLVDRETRERLEATFGVDIHGNRRAARVEGKQMNVYAIQEDGETNCYKAATPMEAIEAAILRFIKGLDAADLGSFVHDHGEPPREWFLRTCFESCSLLGELVNDDTQAPA